MDRITISHTQLETYEDCPRRYQYIYRHHLEKRVGIAALWSRELLHPAMAALYRTGYPVDTQALWDQFVEQYQLEALQGPPYTFAMLEECVLQYAERFYTADCEQYAPLPSEQMRFLNLRHKDHELLYLSVPDVVLVERTTGEAAVLDFKASKRISPLLVSPFNRQFLGQALAVGAQKILVTVFELDQTKTGKPKVAVTRHELVVQEDLAEEWVAELGATVARIATADETGVWPKSAPKACYSYAERCPYALLCEAGELRHRMIEEWPKQPPRTRRED